MRRLLNFWRYERLLLCLLLVTVWVPAGRASAAGADSGEPAIGEWLNQTLQVRETVEAVDRPAPDGKPSGRIRARAEVKAIGIVAGGDWVQIELPDGTHAYLPRTAVELATAATPRPPSAQPAASQSAAEAAPAVIRGPVTKVPNAATLVVAEHRIRLSGIDPGPFSALPSFETWLRGQGALLCEPETRNARYRCFTASGIDVAEAAILNGAGRVGDGATPSYRERENEAREARRGLWQGL